MNRTYATVSLVFASLVVAVALSMVVSTADAADQDPPPVSAVSPLMRMKLDNSKMILEGLTTEDFDKIGKGARALKLLSMESGWNIIQTEEYAKQSVDFRRSCDLIAKAAEDKDIHRATLGYVSLTVRCVECHSYMRRYEAEQELPD